MSNIYKIKDLPDNKILSGIYKINFPNGKSYIGLSNNIKKRIHSHNERDYKLKRLVGNAINKYGKITEFEVLEEIPVENRQLMLERERYWIAYYHTWIEDPLCKGYNVTQGGDINFIGFGTKNPNAAFNEQQISFIYEELLFNKEKSIFEIAKEFGVARKTISAINTGQSYYNERLTYPIRTKEESNKNLLTGTKSICSKLSIENLESLIQDIQTSNLTFTEIGIKYNISNSTVGLINKGKRYHNENLIYPLRNKEKTKKICYSRN